MLAARRAGDPDPEHPGPVRGQVLRQRLDRLVRFLLRLDDDHAAVAVPGQGDGTHPEVLEQREVERRVVLQHRGSGGGHVRRSASPEHLIEKLVDTLG